MRIVHPLIELIKVTLVIDTEKVKYCSHKIKPEILELTRQCGHIQQRHKSLTKRCRSLPECQDVKYRQPSKFNFNDYFINPKL